MTAYAEKKARLLASIAVMRSGGQLSFGLRKRTSNLFRDRTVQPAPRLDLSHFDNVVRVDRESGLVEAEGMTTFVDLADATLQHDAVPAVVPQLKSITLGGAVAGIGIEASSFRHGLVHDTVTQMEVLTGDGRILHCTPDNEHRDLFLGLPNSYGTLGYALKLTARTVHARRYVRLEHTRYGDASAFFAAIQATCSDTSVDYVDGVVFGRNELVLTRGTFTDVAPVASDYTTNRIYYRSLLERVEDHLTTRDFLWRWDTDWFWCSRNVGAQNPVIRRLFGRKHLNSITYQRLMRWNSRIGATRLWNWLRHLHAESVIQDVDIPIDAADRFLAFLHESVGILPIWICPITLPDRSRAATFYSLRSGTVWINFGFWDVVRSRKPQPPGFCNRKIEREVASLGGHKSLYSEAYYPEQEFWSLHDRRAYVALKHRYDPEGALGDLYAKCVLRQ